MIDSNVYLSRWPTRRLPLDDSAKLAAKLKSHGVTQAWAGSFDGLLHADMSAVNARLTEDCRTFGDGLFVPFGCVNPLLPGWEEDLRQCHETHAMPGIRLHPNYHGYDLDHPRFAQLLQLAVDRSLVVQLAVRMEDPRTQHRLLRAADVNVEPLATHLTKLPQLRLQLLNAANALRADAIDKLAAAGRCHFEIAMLEGVGGVAKLLSHLPQERLLFGSYAPFFAWNSAQLKLQESPLGEVQRAALRRENAIRLLPRS